MKKLLTLFLLLPFLVIGQSEDPCYSINEVFSQMGEDNLPITKNFVGGWNMFGFPCSQVIDLAEAFSSIVDNVIIVKDNNGNVYMPEFGFNGIGLLEGGEGYQIKMSSTEYGFSFCESINWPNLEGCTDCEASNFNQWANIDDGSCNYDSDGDGVNDSDEVVGCQDTNACNYDELATDEGECTYALEGYDCNGNLTAQIGDEFQGGILFYIDESEQHGLVAAMEDLEGTYEWGCLGSSVSGANDTAISTGYQNTLDIVSQGCATDNGDITAAQAALDYESEGHTDWYLPSKDELLEIYSVIGQGSLQNGNMGGFANDWYFSSSEYNGSNAWSLGFHDGTISTGSKSYPVMVRPICSF